MEQRVKKTLGENLFKLRKLKGVSQTAMGNIARISQKTVSNLERAQSESLPNLQTLIYVAEYFKIHPGVLLMADLTDDTLTDSEVSLMLERFAQLSVPHKRRIMDLIGDYWSLEAKQTDAS